MEANGEAEKRPEPVEIPEEVMEKAPIKPGTIFDPETELKEVLKFSGKERKEKFEEYREKFAYQKEGLAKMQQAVRDRIMEYPETSEEELTMKAGEFAAEYGFSVDQLLSTASAIRQYEERHKTVQEILSRFVTEKDGRPATDAEALFRVAFFENPVGKIEVFATPTAIYFRSYDQRDYYQALKVQANLNGKGEPDFSKTKTTLGLRTFIVNSKIEKCLLAEADGAIIIENFGEIVGRAKAQGGSEEDVRRRAKEESKSTFLHEEQHSVQEIFDNPLGPGWGHWREVENAETEEEGEMALRRFIREQKRVMEARAKGELLAYSIGNMNAGNAKILFEDARKSFRRGGAYDYYTSHAEKAREFLIPRLGDKNKKLVNDSLDKILGDDYEATVLKGVDALEELLSGDYSEDSRNRARNLLSTVSLKRWPREVEKFLKH